MLQLIEDVLDELVSGQRRTLGEPSLGVVGCGRIRYRSLEAT